MDKTEFEAELRRDGFRVVNSSVQAEPGCTQSLP